MRERVLNFGERDYLVGVASVPDRVDPERPAFVFLNAGVLHHVGPSRTYVKIARRLAAKGFVSLRFDLGGLGDSGTRRDTMSFDEAVIEEVRTAMSCMESELGCRRFVLAGLCSGARMAVTVASEDERVAGIVAIDGHMFRTMRFWWRRFTGRKRSILSAAAVRVAALRARSSAEPAVTDMERGTMRGTRDQVAADLERIVSHGARQYWVFTGSFADIYNYRDQHQDAFKDVDFGDTLEVDFLPTALHVLPGLENQRIVVEKVVDWAERQWPSA